MKVQEVAVGNFIPHPATVVAVNLTTIRTDSGEHFTTTAIRASLSYTNLYYTYPLCQSHVTVLELPLKCFDCVVLRRVGEEPAAV